MPLLKTLVRGLSQAPGYTLMRAVARFACVRALVAGARSTVQHRRLKRFLSDCEAKLPRSAFTLAKPENFVSDLSRDGAAFGLRLLNAYVEEIRRFAEQRECHADREESRGFTLAQRGQAEQALGKPILVAQYFNTEQQCEGIARLARDPLLLWVAARYLGSVPTLVGANLWWTFPVAASQADRDRHAHLYHRDVDDFRFFKFFFYLTDVQPGDGGHMCVLGSHRKPPARTWADRWKLRRYTDAEIEAAYPAQAIREIAGPAGTGFAENTLCIHKGLTPTREPRLLLQLQFALFDHGQMHDRRPAAALSPLVQGAARA